MGIRISLGVRRDLGRTRVGGRRCRRRRDGRRMILGWGRFGLLGRLRFRRLGSGRRRST
ncbi:hypothetical protein ACWEF6_12405 [Amycolatopsis sp. NPDC004772]